MIDMGRMIHVSDEITILIDDRDIVILARDPSSKQKKPHEVICEVRSGLGHLLRNRTATSSHCLWLFFVTFVVKNFQLT